MKKRILIDAVVATFLVLKASVLEFQAEVIDAPDKLSDYRI